MAQQVYRGNLSASTFPLLSTLQGKSVIVKGQDQTFIPAVTSTVDTDKDAGIPQIYYAENIMPHAQGFQAVGYTDLISAAILATGNTFSSVHTLTNGAGDLVYMGVTTAGTFYVATSVGSGFIEKLVLPTAANKLVTVAHIAGVSYIYIANVGCYVYDFGTSLFVATTLTGLTAANVVGLVAAGGYLVAWTTSEIAWSSTIDPTDFTPDLATGAGGGAVEYVIGYITFCTEHSQGLYIYSYGSVVVGIVSGNVRYPFNFKPVAGAGGCVDTDLTVIRSNSAAQFAYTAYGIQLIAPTGATNQFSDVVDFVAGRTFESFDSTTNLLTQESLTAVMQKRLTVIANRYLIVSYGKTSLTHALVFDTQQKRWGKLAIDHVDIFEHILDAPESSETPKKLLTFLKSDGSCKTLNMDLHSSTSTGVIILGKFQYVRSRALTIQEVTLDNIYAASTTTCHLLTSLAGKDLETAVAGVRNNPDSSLAQTYNFRKTGLNHSVLVKGAFHLVSIVLTFSLHGGR